MIWSAFRKKVNYASADHHFDFDLYDSDSRDSNPDKRQCCPRSIFAIQIFVIERTSTGSYRGRRLFLYVNAYGRPEEMLVLSRKRLFSEISVSILHDVPEMISFSVIGSKLCIGDLVLLWDKPDDIFPNEVPKLFWPERDGVTPNALVPSTDRLNYLAPVLVVSFTF
jgi:hypothetical protein